MSANMQINTMIGIRPVDTGAAGQAPSAMMKAVAGYSPGDKLSAEVVSVAGKDVNLQLPDGTQVTTQFPDGVPARTGDMVDLMLVSKQPGNVQLRLEAVNGQSVHLEASQMDMYLMDRGIPSTQLNEAAAQVFMRNGIQPTPRNISNLVDIAAKLPDIPTSLAVMMAENNIPPTQENADILAKWSSGPASLGSDVASLENMVSQQSGVTEFANALQSNLNQTAGGSLSQSITQAPGFDQLAQQLSGMTGQDGSDAARAIQSFVATLDMPPQEQQAAQNALMDAFASTAAQTGDPIQQAGQTQVPTDPQTPMQQAADQTAQTQQTAAQGAQTPVQQGENTAAAQQAQSGDAQVPSSLNQTPGSQQQTAAVNNEAAPDQTTQASAQQGETTGAQGTSQTNNARPVSETQVQEEVARTESDRPASSTGAVQSEETQEQPSREAAAGTRSPEAEARTEASHILSNLQKMVVRARGERGSAQVDGEAFRQGLKQQQELTNLTKAAVTRLFGQNATVTQRAGDMSNQVRLGNQMDQFYYAQIPFQTPQQNGTADLYVFKRNPQKSEAERTHVTVLIGLDTQHMGRVESVLRSAEGRLSVEFRVSTAAVQRYFEESVRQFSEEMKESGFELDGVRVTQIKEKVTPLNAMKVMEPKQTIKLQGLDIEA